MISHIREYDRPGFYLFSGPVKSNKSETLIELVNNYKGSEKNFDDWLLVAKHPKDDKDSRKKISSLVRSSIDAIECKYADEIASKIKDETKFVIISGIHLYNKNIVNLCDNLRESGRVIIASGINLKFDGTNYGSIGELMAIADDCKIMPAICNYDNCNKNAYRTQRIIKNNKEIFEPRCIIHHNPEGRPDFNPFLIGQEPSLESILGPMFSGKTNAYYSRYFQFKFINEEQVISFKWKGDDRYSNKMVVSHDEYNIPSVEIKKADEILGNLDGNEKIKIILIDEAQFIPSGIGDVIWKLLYKGYKIVITGLGKTFQKEPFGDIPRILPLSTEIIYKRASCIECGRPATVSQRFITKNGKEIPANYDGKIIEVGAKEKYKAVDRPCFKQPGRPEPKYKFNKI